MVAQVLGGRYRLMERLGHGGMSVVWLGHDAVLGRPVAVKLLTPRFAAHGQWADRIRIEAQAAARLSHPHVTAVHDYGESTSETGEPVPYVVMELLSGRTLADRLREGPLPAPAALLVCAQVASALAAAHAAGLVHRDIKPSNVMLTPAGVKVLDFGLAAEAGAAAESLLDGEVLGTPAYLAPERLIAGEVVPASDVYGLGLLLYATVTGGLPWRAETVTELLSAHWYAEPAQLPPAVGLPRTVRGLYQRCLAKDPWQRPTAQEVATGLAEATVRRRHGRSWAAAAVSSTTRLPDAGPAPVRSPVPVAVPTALVQTRHNRWGAVALAGSAAVVVAALAGGLMVPHDEVVLPDVPVPGVAAPEPAASLSPGGGTVALQDARPPASPVAAGPPGPEDMVPVANEGASAPGSGGDAPKVSPPAGTDPDSTSPAAQDPAPADPTPADQSPTSSPPASPPASAEPEPSPQVSPGPLDPVQTDPGSEPVEPSSDASPVEPSSDGSPVEPSAEASPAATSL